MESYDVGYGERVITPALPCALSGYGVYLNRIAEKVLDDLKVRALVLEVTGADRMALISFDLIGFSIDFADSLRRLIAKEYSIPFEAVLVSCTHTHTGPPTVPIRGMGEVSPAYMEGLKSKTLEALASAGSGMQPMRAEWNIREVEPIGFNRISQSLAVRRPAVRRPAVRRPAPLDSSLGMISFKGEGPRLYVVNFSCHPVTLGVSTSVSADFPGRLIAEMEKNGHRAIYLQGFCGDVDPSVNREEWGSGREEDIDSYGKHLAAELTQSERSAGPRAARLLQSVKLGSKETRIKLPLHLPDRQGLKRVVENFERTFGKSSKTDRFAAEWLDEASTRLSELSKSPYVENVPIQVLRIGEFSILAYPAEVFCRIGLSLKEIHGPAMTVGYANGYVGYIPTERAYENPNDYASYLAPMFATLFPFSPKAGELLLQETASLIDS
jgi:hypothetical protein